MRSGAQRLPPDASHPASPILPARISNRQWKGLEIAVTPTKQTPDPFLIDNVKQPFRKIACRAGCLPTIKPAPSEQPRCRTTTQSTNSRPLVAHHGESQNLYPCLAGTRPRTACAVGYLTNSAISNRQWKGLEIAATHTKQTSDPFLIDNKNALFRRKSRLLSAAAPTRRPAGAVDAIPRLHVFPLTI